MATITKPVALDETLQRVADAVEEMAQVDSVIDDSIVANNATWSSEKIDDKFSQQSQSLMQKLTEPSGAQVGQFFRVASINEDGTLVLEAVDAPSGGVKDVTIDGKSILDENSVAAIPYAYYNVPGVVKIQVAYGVGINSAKELYVNYANQSVIDGRSSAYLPIMPYFLDYAVKTAMSAPIADTAGMIGGKYHYPAWTAEEQAAAQTRIGILSSEEVLF